MSGDTRNQQAACVSPLAAVAPGAQLAPGCVVEAFAVVGEGVTLGEECWVGPHVVLTGKVKAGARNRFFAGASVGAISQDLRREEAESWVVLGDDNLVRENVTINAGTTKEFGVTSIGDSNLIMAGCHIAHDCVIENGVVMANNVLLGGHVRIREYASIGGSAAVHHFVTIGRRAFIGGLTRVIHDVPPWLLIEGNPARVKAVNVVGAERHGLDAARIKALREAFRRLYKSEGKGQRMKIVTEMLGAGELCEEVIEVLESIQRTSRGEKGRFLECFRQDTRRLDIDNLPARDRPRPAQ